MSGTGLFSYLFAAKEPCDDTRAWDWMKMDRFRRKLEDPDYIRHDPYHAALAQKDFRLYDQLWDLLCTMRGGETDPDIRALQNKIAEATLRIFDYNEKIFKAQMREQALVKKPDSKGE